MHPHLNKKVTYLQSSVTVRFSHAEVMHRKMFVVAFRYPEMQEAMERHTNTLRFSYRLINKNLCSPHVVTHSGSNPSS